MATYRARLCWATSGPNPSKLPLPPDQPPLPLDANFSCGFPRRITSSAWVLCAACKNVAHRDRFSVPQDPQNDTVIYSQARRSYFRTSVHRAWQRGGGDSGMCRSEAIEHICFLSCTYGKVKHNVSMTHGYRNLHGHHNRISWCAHVPGSAATP